MTKTISTAFTVAGLILILLLTMIQPVMARSKDGRSTNREPSSISATGAVLRPKPQEAQPADPFQFEYITSSVEMGAGGYFDLSVLNCSSNKEQQIQVEVYASVKSGYAGNIEPILITGTEVITIKPKHIYTLRHNRRSDSWSGNAREYWIRIKASSELLIPKVEFRYFRTINNPNPSQPPLKLADYLPGDFAVYSRHPFERIR